MSLDFLLLCLKIASLAGAAWLGYEMWRRDPNSNDPTVLFGKFPVTQKGLAGILLFFLVVSIMVAVIDHVVQQQSEEKALRLATTTAERAGASAIQATEAVEQMRDVFKEVVRISIPIERIELSVSFTLPLDDPSLAAYKVQLDNTLARTPKGPTNRWCTSWNFSMGRGERRSARGQDTIRGDHPTFPGNAQDDTSSAIGVDRIELLLYKQPIVAEDFFWPTTRAIISTGSPTHRVDPDLGLTAPFSQEDRWCLIKRFRKRGTEEQSNYILELTNWSMPEPQWERDSIDIQYAHDLPGAQLILDLGGEGKAADIRSSIEISAIELLINGKPVDIEPEDLHKHISKSPRQEGHPYWEFEFPDEFDSVFRSSTR